MNDAAERLGQSGALSRCRTRDTYRVDSGDGKELGKATWKSRDAVLAVVRALMRVARAAVLAETRAGALTVQSLVYDDRLARPQFAYVTPAFLNDRHYLVAENLR